MEVQIRNITNEPTTLVIGDDNIIREGVTIHRGTIQDRGINLSAIEILLWPILILLMTVF